MKTNLKNKLRPIPKFKSLGEEANFWDSHDLTEYFDFSKSKWGRFVLEKSKKEGSLTIRLQINLINKIKAFAASNNLTTSSLARTWLTERLATVL